MGTIVPFDKCKLRVPLRPEPWPLSRDELVVVNSFGIGGSNAVVSRLMRLIEL